MAKYVCGICGYIYDEARGIPDAGIAPGTKWEELPDDWVCPLCGASKVEFAKQKEETESIPTVAATSVPDEEVRELSFAEMSMLCSNLAKGCEKQYLARESELFGQLADYYQQKAQTPVYEGFRDLANKINQNLSSEFPAANAAAAVKPDRGAMRALVWSEKVTKMLNSLIGRYEKEGDSMLDHTNIYVCEICGFIYIGDTPPLICPVCKVPNKKLTKVERG
ncbi:MAG: rubredoxin [bacterium]|nr:rubredoxin [bacterium]